MTEEHKDPNKPKLRLSRDSEESKVEDVQPDAKKLSKAPEEATPAPKQSLQLKRENAESAPKGENSPTPDHTSDTTSSNTEPETKPKPALKPKPKPEPEPKEEPEAKQAPEAKEEPRHEKTPDTTPVKSIEKEPEPIQAPPPPSPPKIPEKSTESASDDVGAKVEKSADYLEQKESSSLLSSILVVFALLAVLSGSGYGLYYILKSPADDAANADTADTTESTGGSLSGPINKAKDVAAQKAALVEEASPIIEAGEQAVEPATPVDSKQTASDFLTNASLSGVRSGDNPKVILNGESFSKGDLIEPSTGLRFIGIKDQKLVFRDANGIVYIKSF